MAIRNLNGHAVSSVAPAHHQQVSKANLSFPDTMGPAGYQGMNSKPGGGLPGGSGGKGGNARSPKEVSPPNAMTTGNR